MTAFFAFLREEGGESDNGGKETQGGVLRPQSGLCEEAQLMLTVLCSSVLLVKKANARNTLTHTAW